MNWDVPNWWQFVLIVLAGYRVWRLLALDAVFDRWRQPVLRRIPQKLHEGVECPYCFGAWVIAAVWILWIAWSHWTLVISTPFALSGALGLMVANWDPEKS